MHGTLSVVLSVVVLSASPASEVRGRFASYDPLAHAHAPLNSLTHNAWKDCLMRDAWGSQRSATGTLELLTYRPGGVGNETSGVMPIDCFLKQLGDPSYWRLVPCVLTWQHNSVVQEPGSSAARLRSAATTYASHSRSHKQLPAYRQTR